MLKIVKKSLNTLAGLGCLVVVALGPSIAQASECGKVSIMQGDWGSAQIVTAVARAIGLKRY